MFLDPLLKNGKGLFLAYDHGFEHGPTDFNEQNVDPSFIMEIAVKGGYTGVILHYGVASKYYDGKVPLILKLNGKTNLINGDPISLQVSTVEEAVSLGAKAVGYTIYPGSIHEHIMFQEFAKIRREAHERGLGVLLWSYPRGQMIKNETAKEIVAYAARLALELGADGAKIKYTGDTESFKWAVKSAGKVKVFMSGGPKASTEIEFLKQVQGVMDAGGSGIAVGRNVWQSKDPLKISEALRKIVFNGYRVEEIAKNFM
ncbi:MAG: class I fructose-bisphosphate aldolase [Thermoprotei archaeon]